MPGGNNFDQVTNKKQDRSICTNVAPTLYQRWYDVGRNTVILLVFSVVLGIIATTMPLRKDNMNKSFSINTSIPLVGISQKP